MADLKVEGVDTVRAKLERLAKQIPNEVAQALYAEAQIEAAESRRRTPVDTGDLRRSHHVTKPDLGGRRISVSIEVGGPAAPYAILVHEDLEAFHPVGQAKFLESTLLESAPYMAQRVARRIELTRLV